jgi:hypothetical protein
MSRHHHAVTEMKKAVEMDPLCLPIQSGMGESARRRSFNY